MLIVCTTLSTFPALNFLYSVVRDEKTLDKDNNPKSKCIAFVEACDTDLATYIIDNLNNVTLQGTKKGLILEFSLEDIRKKIKRERIISEKKTKKFDERKQRRKIKREFKKENIDTTPNQAIDTIDTIKDIPKLMEIYHSTVSRGKKQRIKKRIAKLGFNPNSIDFTKTNRNSAYAKKPIKEIQPNTYIVEKINLNEKRNKKFDEEEQPDKRRNHRKKGIKMDDEEEGNVLKKKRNRKSNSLTKKENFRKNK